MVVSKLPKNSARILMLSHWNIQNPQCEISGASCFSFRRRACSDGDWLRTWKITITARMGKNHGLGQLFRYVVSSGILSSEPTVEFCNYKKELKLNAFSKHRSVMSWPFWFNIHIYKFVSAQTRNIHSINIAVWCLGL